MEDRKEWYVVNTYAGHENRVKESLEKRMKAMDLGDCLDRIVVAEEEEIDYKNGKEIKKIKDIPIIMLSARSEEYDKLFGFELGIDDYVVKPFSPKELMARVNAVLSRNSTSEKPVEKVMKFDGLEINIPARTVTVDGEKVELTPKEYDLLFYLVENKNIALSRDKLLSDIWGYDFFGDDRTIDISRT